MSMIKISSVKAKGSILQRLLHFFKVGLILVGLCFLQQVDFHEYFKGRGALLGEHFIRELIYDGVSADQGIVISLMILIRVEAIVCAKSLEEEFAFLFRGNMRGVH